MSNDLTPSRRHRGAAVLLLSAAAPIAAALTVFATPQRTLASFVAPTSSHANVSTEASGDPCPVASRLRTLGSMKIPSCSGD